MRKFSLTKLGRTVLAYILLAIFLFGAFILELDKAYWFGIGQYAYNTLFLFFLMPILIIYILRIVQLNHSDK